MEAAIAQYIEPFIESLFHTIGWLGVVIIMALESANIPIPSEVTMPLAGWQLVGDHLGYTWWHAFLIGGFYGALGCLLGSVISYGLGFWGGRPLAERYGRYILVDTEDIDKFDHYFQRWGDWISFLSRLLPIIRTFVSFPAGVFKIPFLKFSFYTFVGSFIWCGALATVGWYLGPQWPKILGIMGPAKYPIALAVVAGFVYYVYRHLTAPSRHAASRISD
ncbi:MAG: DedA family protein [Chloroflexi bacterium]|nr:DedA family protein [Chloroflexota bacterium]